MIIYGAGMAGLLAANILRRYQPVIHEAQNWLPNNHAALLRFRTPDVGAACGVRFKNVQVSKAISYERKLYNEPTVFFSNQYSLKVTGSVIHRSIDNLENASRYIAPLNLIELMAVNCTIHYDSKLGALTPLVELKANKNVEPIISTIPMPLMMKLAGWSPTVAEFKFKPIWIQRATITEPDIDVYQTIYYPDKKLTYYRASVMGNTVIIEHSKPPEQNPGPLIMTTLREDFGIDATKLVDLKSSEQKYGKILPIDDKLRKDFILMLSEEYGIYSLGRFATWRQLLLDDLVADIDIIEKFILGSHSYDYSLETIDV